MLTITRSLARQLRALVRKVFDSQTAKLVPVHALADDSGLRIQIASSTYALEYYDPQPQPPANLCIPTSLLQDLEGTRADPVTLELVDGRITASWQEGDIPRTAFADPLEGDRIEFPALPERLTANPPRMLSALADAVATTDQGASRYALGCLQFRGSDGSISATDGRQALKQSGFEFPFDDEVLVHASKVFLGKALPQTEPVQLGRTDIHVVFKIGPWTVYLPIQKDARFPRIDDIVPDLTYAETTVELNPSDCDFTAANLDRLPGNGEPNSPITLDLNGSVAIRAQAEGGAQVTELLLSNSRKTGQDAAFAINRQYLQRAVAMRFASLHVFSDNVPILCQDEHRKYIWARLHKDSIVQRTDKAVPVRSPLVSSRATSISPVPRKTPIMRKRESLTPKAVVSPAAETVTTPGPQRASTASPIEQAIKLRSTLREALSATNDLISAIKRQKKQDRAYKTALASLRQLQDVA